LIQFYRDTSRPLLEDVRVRYEGGDVDEKSVTSVDFPAYFEGSELIMVGKINPEAAHLSVKVSGGSTQVNYSSLASSDACDANYCCR